MLRAVNTPDSKILEEMSVYTVQDIHHIGPNLSCFTGYPTGRFVASGGHFILFERVLSNLHEKFEVGQSHRRRRVAG